jgi:putative serine protease PepD
MSDDDFDTTAANGGRDSTSDQSPTNHDGGATIRPPFYVDGTGQTQNPLLRGDGVGINPADVSQSQPADEAAANSGQGYAGYQPPAGYQTPLHYPDSGYPDSGYPDSGYPPPATGGGAQSPVDGYQAPTNYEPPSTYQPYQAGQCYQPPQTYVQPNPAQPVPNPYGTPSQYGSTAQYPATGQYQSAASHYPNARYGTAVEYGYGPQATATAERAPRMRRTLVGVAVLAAVVGATAGAATVALASSHNKTVASGITVTTKTAQNSAAVTDNTIAGAAKKITPSVVTIQVSGSSESGTGSGVIMNTAGDILTNDHVVSVAGSGGTIVVQTSDGRSAPATIVGVDTTDDLAVVKVGLTGLTPATFADSNAITVGQQVVAVGAPLGLSDTVTSGIVSATKRTVRSGDDDQAVFAAVQTDAAINPGNSGGALVDLNGSVIGINAAIATTGSSGVTVPGQQTTQSGSIGIGFAIPSDEAGRIAAELIATGKATHAAIGVQLPEDTTSGNSATPTVNGATLGPVTAGGPAASAGLKAGDVVTAVGSERISGSDDLIAAIRAYSPGASVQITYTRAGASHTVSVKTISAS